MRDNMPQLKLIKLTGVLDIRDDPNYPFKLEVNLSPPELMSVAFIMQHGGSEELIIRGLTREAIDKFINDPNNAIPKHPRLRWYKITGPDGLCEEFKPCRV